MGLDGGTIATRSDVLRRQSSRVAQNDTSRSSRGGNAAGKVSDPGAVEASVARQTAWSNCALSSQPLQPPLVADGLGRLYNKEAVLQFILCARDKVSEPEALLQYANQLRVAAGGLDHITSLRDVFDVTLTAAERDRATQAGGASSSSGGGGRARGAGSEAVGAGGGGGGGSGWLCPVTLVPCERYPCSALRPCGHVLSDKAIKNLRGPVGGSGGGGGGGGSGAGAGGGGRGGGAGGGGAEVGGGKAAAADMTCPVCGQVYTSTVPINGTSEQVVVLRAALKAAAAAKAAKRELAATGAAGEEAGRGGSKKRRKGESGEAA
ncbi:hypothetical protein CHLRE_17g715950v5 [Chlamydomonas reinhardtii]|uniref:Replication termination factor 2 n=1 Tax=Chlamydomonas reinhardtii TaxID=3055 RepID=A0A2K3CPX4_CHLRE|nr:uncharacterized protein CHLRE_17g715950v5 [Chlamydomonas reinhardtii]PNW70341.1 hypothetical protein CHLRE_17g715950v5 [Chlamydomonas reinhardtii]